MTVPRWISLGMVLRSVLDGPTTFETLSVVVHHHARTDGESRMIRTLLILSLTFASISVISTLFALYWFVRMRRGFRHEYLPAHSPPPPSS